MSRPGKTTETESVQLPSAEGKSGINCNGGKEIF